VRIRSLIVLVLIGGPFGFASNVFADEVQCPNVPEGELKERFDVRGGRSVLRITIPRKYSKATFYELQAAYGDNEEFMVKLKVEKDEGDKLLALIRMPEVHPRLSITAIYHQRDCYSLLEATFVGNARAR